MTVTRCAAATMLAAASCALLAGCSIEIQMPGSDDPKPTETASYDLSFEGGKELPNTVQPILNDTILDVPGWQLKTEKLGEKVYRDANGACTATIHSGKLPTDVVSDGDDRTTTDRYLSHLYGAPESTVKQLAKDTSYVYGDSTVAARTVTGAADDGTTWTTTARVFTSPGFAIFTDITCAPGGNSDLAFADVTLNLTVVTD